MDFIELKGITKRFKEKVVLYNINLDVPKGKIFGIIGRSGCGKTTLLNIIIGYLRPSEGRVFYKGKKLKNVENVFGFASQQSSFYDKLTVEENLRYFGRLYGLKTSIIKNRINELVMIFGLHDALKTQGNNLSKGMQKRLDIACSLIHKPFILILDEPTADLDPILRREVLRIVKRINSLGTTIIITSHILGEIEYLCDEIAILNNGKLVCVDKPSNLEAKVGDGQVVSVELVSMAYRELCKGLSSYINKTSMEGNRLIIFTKEPFKVVVGILKFVMNNKDKLISLKLGRASLNSLFEEIIRKGIK